MIYKTTTRKRGVESNEDILNAQQSTISNFFKKPLYNKDESIDNLRLALIPCKDNGNSAKSPGQEENSEKMEVLQVPKTVYNELEQGQLLDNSDKHDYCADQRSFNLGKKTRDFMSVKENEEVSVRKKDAHAMEIDEQCFTKNFQREDIKGSRFLKKCMSDSENKIEINTNKAFENKFKLNEGMDIDESKFSRTRDSNLQPTLLEQQYLKIKAENKDCIIMTEVGYRYRFFGEDALIAANELNIVAYLDHTLYTASIPTHRLHVHVRRLVQSGHKVGLVQQMETAALKSIGTNKTGPFERKLTKIYSRATFIDDTYSSPSSFSGKEEGNGDLMGENLGYMLYINEDIDNLGCNRTSSRLAIVAVSPSNGNIIYDEFENDHVHDALQTRLLHLAPVEILLSKNRISPCTLKYLETAFSTSPADKLPVRIEFNEEIYKGNDVEAKSYIFDEFEKHIVESGIILDNTREDINRKIDTIKNLDGKIIICMTAMFKHLLEFGLDRVMIIDNNYTSFTSKENLMILDSDVINSLELCDSTYPNTEKNKSLFNLLDHTSTSMGKRTLRSWLVNPLTDKVQILQRHNSVEELIVKNNDPELHSLKHTISTLPDLLKASCRIFYLRSSPSDFHYTMSSFRKLCILYSNVRPGYFNSLLLKQAFAYFGKLENTMALILSEFNPQIAQTNEVIDFLANTSSYPSISECKNDMNNIIFSLNNHLEEIKKELKWNKLSYTTVSGTTHLIEIPILQIAKVPFNWIKISQTKSSARFHTPFIIENLKNIEVCKEKLQLESKQAYNKFLKNIAFKNNHLFKEISNSVGVLDCLMSLATSAITLNYVKPEISDVLEITAKECRNPVVELSLETYTPNDVNINLNKRVLLITGPNMGGKSCYIKQIALLVILTQMGSYVPASYARVSIFTSILTRMGASDDILKGQSTFMKELIQTSNILKSVTDQSLVIIDELGRGTSTHDGSAIAHATLTHFIKNTKCVTLFISHITSLGELKTVFSNDLHCYHMDFIQDKNSENSITFLYKLVEGMAKKSYGLNVARLAGLLPSIIDKASVISENMESETERRVSEHRLQRKLAFLKMFLKENPSSGVMFNVLNYLKEFSCNKL